MFDHSFKLTQPSCCVNYALRLYVTVTSTSATVTSHTSVTDASGGPLVLSIWRYKSLRANRRIERSPARCGRFHLRPCLRLRRRRIRFRYHSCSTSRFGAGTCSGETIIARLKARYALYARVN
jgi:hypothetical protein